MKLTSDRKKIRNGVFFENLMKLEIDTRNKVRAINSLDPKDAVRIIDQLREKKSPFEIIQIEDAIRSTPSKDPKLPEHFPKKPQTEEYYYRLCNIDLEKLLRVVDILTKKYSDKLYSFFSELHDLNNSISEDKIIESDIKIENLIEKYGYSHLLLRKAIFLKSISINESNIKYSEEFIKSAGLANNNIIVTSVLNAFDDQQDILSLKRSIMGIPSKGPSNKFTRDICRLAFHPYAKDLVDLSELLQSCLQSSIIDAIIVIKLNLHLVDLGKLENLKSIIEVIDCHSLKLDQIAQRYVTIEDADASFYQHSGAWLESSEIIRHRYLIDHFYDSHDAEYLNIDDDVVSLCSRDVNAKSISELLEDKPLITHSSGILQKIESQGVIARSAIFNLILHVRGGHDQIGEDMLLELMSKTRDLSKTINQQHAKNLARCTVDRLSKTIIYFLIAKKSRNESDNHMLRKIFQEEVLNLHDGKLINFVVKVGKTNIPVAQYIYEVCTEDFIARLYHIIKTANEITETRAELHRWRGNISGEKIYLERARNIIIDHQINRVRGELNDNRIYVDVARFNEWINDELLGEIISTLTAMKHNNSISSNSGNPQLYLIVERCYFEFCSNSYFGIASYLGRRIRHGTFKGYMFSNMIQIESQFKSLLCDPHILSRWTEWKNSYEMKIDMVIREKIHVESNARREGFLKPNLKNPIKSEIVNSCIQELSHNFIENQSSPALIPTLIDYCWRIAETDLKAINAYLKGTRNQLVNTEILNEIRNSAPAHLQPQAKDFVRDIQSKIDEKLRGIYGWFKRPASVSPKASVQLLFKAVVMEVNETFKEFQPNTDFSEAENIDLMGGAYHVIYDAFYVVIYNAAKHGKNGGQLKRTFSLTPNGLEISIKSEIRDSDSEKEVSDRLTIQSNEDIANAQLHENRSGIRKLYNLESSDKNFKVNLISCEHRETIVSFSYRLGVTK